jgi:hypothetical protein
MLNYPKPLDEQQAQVAEMIAAKAKSMGVPVDLALAMAYQESKFRQTNEKGGLLRSNKGALGIMQVLPDTAREYKFELSDLKDPEKNIDAGLTYLKDLLDKSNGVQEPSKPKKKCSHGRLSRIAWLAPSHPRDLLGNRDGRTNGISSARDTPGITGPDPPSLDNRTPFLGVDILYHPLCLATSKRIRQPLISLKRHVEALP